MVTPPLEERLFQGRGASNIRTPRLIKDYLAGLGVSDLWLSLRSWIDRAGVGCRSGSYQEPWTEDGGELLDLLVLGLLEETWVRKDPTERGHWALPPALSSGCPFG